MLRKMSLSVAFAAICTIHATAMAQSGNVTAAEGEKVEMASYAQDYASSANAGGPVYTGGYMQTPRPMAYGQTWGGAASNRDCSRFYHYPYVFYPQNFQGEDFYKSSDSLYYRYRPEMQIPVYNRHWHNYYPSSRRYHSGHHFLTDVF